MTPITFKEISADFVETPKKIAFHVILIITTTLHDWPNLEINALFSCIKQKIIPRNRQPRAISDSRPMKEEIYKIIFPNCKKSKSKVDFNYIPWNEKHHQKKRQNSFQVEDPHELERVFGKNWNFITHQKMFVCLQCLFLTTSTVKQSIAHLIV